MKPSLSSQIVRIHYNLNHIIFTVDELIKSTLVFKQMKVYLTNYLITASIVRYLHDDHPVHVLEISGIVPSHFLMIYILSTYIFLGSIDTAKII